MVHIDVTAGIGSLVPEPFPIPVPDDDPFFDSDFLDFNRSFVAPGAAPRQVINILSSWQDGSNLYGNISFHGALMRSNTGGKLLEGFSANGEVIPPNWGQAKAAHPEIPSFVTDALQLGLPDFMYTGGVLGIAPTLFPQATAIGALLIREHNRLCDVIDGLSDRRKDRLELPDPGADPIAYDEAVYQLVRKLVNAELQAITYEQYLPAMGVRVGPYTGYDPNARPDVFLEFTTAAFRNGHTMFNELVLRVQEDGSESSLGHFPLAAGLTNPFVVAEGGVDEMLRGMLVQPTQAIDVRAIDTLRNIDLPNIVTDLLASNIQRGRERGIHDFNKVRQVLLGEDAALETFADLTSDPALIAVLEEAYPGGVDTIDPWVGFFAEDRRGVHPMGPSATELFRRQFRLLRAADRFWYQSQLDLDPVFRRALRYVGFSIRGRDNRRRLDRSLAELILDNTTIGSGGFPLDRDSNAFFALDH